MKARSRFFAVLAATGSMATLPGCGSTVPLTDRPCPCSAGWTCCATSNVCVTSASACPAGAPSSYDAGISDGQAAPTATNEVDAGGAYGVDGGVAPPDSLTITEFPLPSGSYSISAITSGPDGNLWFTDGDANAIGRMTTAGVVTEFPVPTQHAVLADITLGPDGNLWFTEESNIGRITPAGVITEFPLSPGVTNPFPAQANDITSGPDGNLWFTEGQDAIGTITTSGVVSVYPRIQSPNPKYAYVGVVGLAAGPDGDLWFAERELGQMGRMTTSGDVTAYAIPPLSIDGAIAVGPQPDGVTVGADGNLWFAVGGESANTVPVIARMTPGGSLTQFLVPASFEPGAGSPLTLALGADGNVWFAGMSGMMAKISTTGAVGEYPIPKANYTPMGVTSGPDGNIWFTEGLPNLSCGTCGPLTPAAIGRINLKP